MLRLKAERRSPSTVSGATASESRITKTPDVVHSSTSDPAANRERTFARREDPLGAARGLVFALVFDLFLIAFVVAAAYLVGYIAVHVPTAVVILGGLVLIGLVVVRGAASS